MKTLAFYTGLFGLILCFLAGSAVADDHSHENGRELFKAAHADSHLKELTKHLGNGEDKGNETTGEIAAWLGAAVNLSVIISLLIKGLGRFAPLSDELKGSLKHFNAFQKKHLMPFHYFLNPVVIGIAFLHWLLSRCRSSAMPEWGLFLMVAIGLLGLAIKLRWVPRDWLKTIYRLHTHPLGTITLITLLFVGHSIVD